MGKFISRLPELLDRAEFKAGRPITQRELATRTGLRESTISKFMQPGAELIRLDANVAAALVNFFNQYFVCRVEDLYYFENDTQEIDPIDPTGQPWAVTARR